MAALLDRMADLAKAAFPSLTPVRPLPYIAKRTALADPAGLVVAE
ncbi:hypothetical protein [Blastochloris tepida]|jgi:hypothetical protein|uniref:Uncharacterized protein n=1 Tax=Blastochloris tepida TaxID=2233851 RepID=A0A348FZ59_9HYPH|nr:hypothetical protein [Blastochloris tepida]BBF92592.1 hypothetical protein BLTE_12770 [Blastochloris tepida]